MGKALPASQRKRILQRDAYECQMQLPGCLTQATTVDHITPVHQGGDDTDQNLRAACTACNYSKGGKEGRNLQLGRQKAAQPRLVASGGVGPFLGEPSLPPVGRSLSLPESEPVRQTSSELEPVVYGSVEPRIHSQLLGGKSEFDEMLAWLTEFIDEQFWPPGSDSPLLPWQAWLLRDALTVDDAGEFVRKSILTIVARQQGKTHMVKLLIAYLMCTRPGFRVVGTAQKLTLAKQTWEDVCELFEFSPKLKGLVKGEPRRANGQEALTLLNRSKYSIIAATRRARGFTAEMLFVDELREIPPDAWEAIQPFLTTTGGQLWATSNAGDSTSETLNEIRANLIAYPDRGSAIYEWSAPDKAKIDDREAWRMASPSMGYLPKVNYAMLENALRSSTSQNHFRAERLCQFVLSLDPAIPMDSYEDCAADVTAAPSAAQCWFAIDATPDSKRADLVVAIEGERITLAPLRSWTHEGAVDDQRIADEIAALAQEWRPRLIGYNAYAAPGIGDRLQRLGHPVKNITGVEFAQACDQLLSAVVHQRIQHPNDPTMLQHFAHSVAKPTADGGWRLYRRESGGYISMACASAMAVSLASVPRTTPLIMAV